MPCATTSAAKLAPHSIRKFLIETTCIAFSIKAAKKTSLFRYNIYWHYLYIKAKILTMATFDEAASPCARYFASDYIDAQLDLKFAGLFQGAMPRQSAKSYHSPLLRVSRQYHNVLFETGYSIDFFARPFKALFYYYRCRRLFTRRIAPVVSNAFLHFDIRKHTLLVDFGHASSYFYAVVCFDGHRRLSHGIPHLLVFGFAESTAIDWLNTLAWHIDNDATIKALPRSWLVCYYTGSRCLRLYTLHLPLFSSILSPFSVSPRTKNNSLMTTVLYFPQKHAGNCLIYITKFTALPSFIGYAIGIII